MKPSQEVTALRKGGRLDEAFKLAADLAANPEANEWELSAYGWCLIDLVKRHAADSDKGLLRNYLGLLTGFEVPRGNDLLAEHKERALALADDNRRAIMEARKLGKDGQHERAVRAFAALLADGVLTRDDKVAFGWELFRAIQTIFRAGRQELTPSAIDIIKRHLNTYLKLGVSEPGLLHSCMLQQAVRLSHGDHLRLVAFSRLWNLEFFRPEDFKETQSDDGKVFQPLGETVLQRASKEAVRGGSSAEKQYILPHVERGLERFPDNVWLKLNLVKLLRDLNRIEDARRLATEFARSKAGEYWTWELIGDLEAEPGMRLSCYAKALTGSEDDTFIGKLRLKFAALIAADYPAQAKAEVERVIEHRRREGTRIPAEAQHMAQSEWFLAATPSASGRAFYDRFKLRAEELLFAHLPWTDASVGDEFMIEGQEGQKNRMRRRLYAKASPLPIEISVSASHPDVRRCQSGAPIRVQMETLPGEPWKTIVHRIQPRDGAPDDVIRELCGVIDHVNQSKSLLHFVVAKGVDGTLPLADFVGSPEIGQAVVVRMTRYHSRKGARTRTLAVSPTSQSPGADVLKSFSDSVEVRNGLGFTSAGIFIPPDIVASAKIAHGDEVNGVAVINYDTKRSTWGWKAIKAESSARPATSLARPKRDFG